MTLTRRPTNRTAIPLRTVLERLAGDWPVGQFDGGLTDLAPPLDVRETNNAYVVEIDLPGVDPDGTEVLVEGRVLTVRGSFATEDEHEQGNYLVRERRQGSFMRAVALPGMVEIDQVKSKFEDGKLTITLPKASQNRARRILIGTDKPRQKQISAQQAGGTSKASSSKASSSKSSSTKSGASPASSSQPTRAGATQSRTAGEGR
jgi:HSP20 family protein